MPVVRLKHLDLELAASLAPNTNGSCIQSPIASKLKPRVSELESNEFLDSFNRMMMNTESSSRILSFDGKNDSVRVTASESESSDDDDTPDEILSMDSTSFSTEQDVQNNKITICNLLLLDVCPLGLGIEDINGEMHTLICRNTVIPTQTDLYPIFTNAFAYQTTATIRIFEGEHYLTKYNVCNVLTL